MSNTIEYLVKYSVAPPPSRDYYGLKVLQDEVILYLWKISHGPHKAPIIHRVKCAEFSQDKILHDKIRHGFGEHLLEHVRNIAERNRNLLTLPISLIEKISKYLSFRDITNLSLLSRVSYEIFNNDSIWQVLYNRDKTARISLEEEERAKVYGWKQFYKIRQMQTSIKSQKNSRIQLSMKSANVTKTTKSSLNLTTSASKPASKITSTTITKKRSESSDLVTIPLSKTVSNTRFGPNTVDEKSLSQKKPVRNGSNSLNAQKKNAQKDLVASKTMTKPERKEIKNISNYSEVSDKQQSKREKYANKIDNVIKMQEDKSKSVTSKIFSSKSSTENIKASSSSQQNSRKKSFQSKAKNKSDKVAATNSEIFNADKDLFDNPFATKNDELADLIEASLKNIRSPRSIFDPNFSYMQQPNATTKNVSRTKNVIQSVDKIEYPKSITNNVASSHFYNKMIRGDGILDKLSEKSFSASSSESLANDKNSLPGGDSKPVKLSEKFLKAQAELRDVLDWRHSDPAPSENRWNLPSFRNNKSFSPRKIRTIDEKYPIAKGPLRNVSLLNAYASNSLESRKDNPRKDTKIVLKNQISSTKLADDIE